MSIYDSTYMFDEFPPESARGRKLLTKLRELEELSINADRIRRAVKDGLLPNVTPEKAEAIAAKIARDEDRALAALDRAEGYW